MFKELYGFAGAAFKDKLGYFFKSFDFTALLPLLLVGRIRSAEHVGWCRQAFSGGHKDGMLGENILNRIRCVGNVVVLGAKAVRVEGCKLRVVCERRE